MTLLEDTINNITTPLVKRVAAKEGVPAAKITRCLKDGTLVIPKNNKHNLTRPCAIGPGVSTKINANIGTSTDKPDIAQELKKLEVAVKYGADAVMDLSTGGDLRRLRREILRRSPVPVGTVPVYEVAVGAERRSGNLLEFAVSDVLSVLESQAKDGVDFFTIHSGVTRRSLQALRKNRRVLDIVSRGGSIIAGWMSRHKKENPFFEYFDRILDIARAFDITLSLGDGLRPGSISDATDKAQITELRILGELAQRAKEKGVQVMIEGPGHVPLDQIKKNIDLEKKICRGAPFYVLGPLVTDAAAGYDHISASIGGAIAAAAGADFLCYVTPSEHLRHPSVDDVRQGVVASKIAAHAADIVKGIKPALERDLRISMARRRRDWRSQIALSIDPYKARQLRESSRPKLRDVCTMCGKYCSIKLTESCLGN